MPEQGSPDPAEQFRELLTRLERGVDNVANRLMGSEEFSRGINRVQSAQLSLQNIVREVMAQHLSNINMPSRDEVLELGDLLRSVDKRLVRVEQLLEDMAPAAQARQRPRKGPPRTKQPPSRRAATPPGS
jgi:hypothetical protein